MKKALALVMALAMVMSMAAVSMASSVVFVDHERDDADAATLIGFNSETYAYNKDWNAKIQQQDTFEYGDTVYLIPLVSGAGVTEEKTISNLTFKGDWDEGGKYVESIEVVKKSATVAGTEGKYYFVVINTTGEETSQKTVSGDILVKGRSGDSKAKINGYISVEFKLGYDSYNGTITDTKSVFKATAKDEYTFYFGSEDEFEVTVNMNKDDKVILACDEDVIEEVDEAYPNANINYYTLTGSFKKTAEVCVALEEGEEYLYQVVDGKVVEVNGEYDDWSEEFTFKTRTLGTYIISDAKLTTAAVAVTNPTTGAAA